MTQSSIESQLNTTFNKIDCELNETFSKKQVLLYFVLGAFIFILLLCSSFGLEFLIKQINHETLFKFLPFLDKKDFAINNIHFNLCKTIDAVKKFEKKYENSTERHSKKLHQELLNCDFLKKDIKTLKIKPEDFKAYFVNLRTASIINMLEKKLLTINELMKINLQDKFNKIIKEDKNFFKEKKPQHNAQLILSLNKHATCIHPNGNYYPYFIIPELKTHNFKEIKKSYFYQNCQWSLPITIKGRLIVG